MVRISLAPVLRASTVAAFALSLSLGAAQAQSGATPSAPRAVSVQLANGVTFNWLAKKATKGHISNATVVTSEGAQPRKSRFFGKGSYICSPAGFGKKSRCFAR